MLDLIFRGRRLVFDSPLSAGEITARLQRDVAPVQWTLKETRPQPFEGTVAGNRFQMARLVRGRNSFRAMIDGTVHARPGGAHVEVCLRLHPLVAAFLSLLFLFGSLIGVIAVSEALDRGEATPQLLVVPGLVVAALGLLAIAGVEARKATRMLAAVLGAGPSVPA